MSARDDYPARPDGTTWTVDKWPEMCDEIDRLRRITASLRVDLHDRGNRR